MLTVEQQLDELTAKVDKLYTSVEFANTGVASLTKNVSNLTDTITTLLDKVNIVEQWSKDADKLAGDLETAMLKLTSRVQVLEQAPNAAPPLVPSREEGGRARATANHRLTRVCCWGNPPCKPPWSRVSTNIHNPHHLFFILIIMPVG
jgi:predicted RecB family endonuclease